MRRRGQSDISLGLALQSFSTDRVTPSVRNPESEKSALKWLILIGLLCAQMAFASHQMAHDADDLGDTCQSCSGFERVEDGVSDTAVAITFPAATTQLSPSPAGRDITSIPQVYSARASPEAPNSSS